VATALPDVTLPSGDVIESTSIHGIASQAMLCSGMELGLEDSSEGLYLLDDDAPIGQRVDDYLQLADWVIDIDLTPNRGDCLSILGIARECAVLTGSTLKRTDVPGCAAETDRMIDVVVSTPQACPRYLGRVVEDIDDQASTPVWMRERLRRCGIRPINPVVDVTNYVMLELGQPMHAFDLDRLTGGICVRTANPGEAIGVLDGSELRPDGDTLLIADHQRAIAVAGVMGGTDSGIDAGTRHIVLEAAHFTPSVVAGKARSFGVSSESAYRFERGVDPELPFPAIHYASALLKNIVGGKFGPVIDRTAKRCLPKRPPVKLRHVRLEQVLGMQMAANEVDTMLRRAASVVRRRDKYWEVKPPSYRFDIQLECDLIEELIRIHGYHRVPVSFPKSSETVGKITESQLPLTRVRALLTDRDYQEIITYSFVDHAVNGLFDDNRDVVRIANPIADNMSVMRPNMWRGLVQAAITNINRQQRRIRLFEVGHTFHSYHGERREILRLGGLVCGNLAPEQWGQASQEVDFYDVKADVESILALTGHSNRFTYNQIDRKGLHPGQSAEIFHESRAVGCIGRIHPQVQRELDLESPLFLFQLDLGPLLCRNIPQFTKPSRFPAIQRDLSIIVGTDISAEMILNTVIEAGGKRIVNLNLFDVYRGEGIDPGRKSVAFGLTLQDSSRTLTDEDVDSTISEIIAALDRRFGAQLRT
jgi:phenylalanyl-tRNA synthetase beta chain